MTPELLQLQTYDRVFQRLVSTHKEIPLGIYRTSLIKPKDKVSQHELLYCSIAGFRVLYSLVCM